MDFLPAVYDELRRVAAAYLHRERPDHTLQPTALVHEAYLRLSELKQIEFADRAEFVAAAAGTFRRVLVDHARAKGTEKRGGSWNRLTLSGVAEMKAQDGVDVIELDDAITRLGRLDERLSRVVELRFFGGLSIEETARVLGVGVTTVKERWQFARAWLQRELSDSI